MQHLERSKVRSKLAIFLGRDNSSLTNNQRVQLFFIALSSGAMNHILGKASLSPAERAWLERVDLASKFALIALSGVGKRRLALPSE